MKKSEKSWIFDDWVLDSKICVEKMNFQCWRIIYLNNSDWRKWKCYEKIINLSRKKRGKLKESAREKGGKERGKRKNSQCKRKKNNNKSSFFNDWRPKYPKHPTGGTVFNCFDTENVQRLYKQNISRTLTCAPLICHCRGSAFIWFKSRACVQTIYIKI